MADTTNGFSADKVEKAQELLRSMKEDAQKAFAEGDTFMLSVYNDLLRVCSPIVVKALARLEREENATLNKQEKEMRKKEREEREAQRQRA